MKRFLRSATFAAAAAALALGAWGARAQNTTTTVKPDGSVETKTVTIDVTGGPRMEIYGFAQLDMGYDFKQVNPDWFDVLRVTKLPVVREPVRRGRQDVRGRPPEPPRRQGLVPVGARRDQDDLRVRALRRRRRRGPDDVPPPARVGRARAVRRGPDVEPVHGPGRLPELARVLGPVRHGPLPERPGALDADAGRQRALHRPRAARGERRRRRLRRPRGAAGREDPVAVPGHLGPLQDEGQVGPRPARRHRPLHQVGRQRTPTRSTSRAARRAGA